MRDEIVRGEGMSRVSYTIATIASMWGRMNAIKGRRNMEKDKGSAARKRMLLINIVVVAAFVSLMMTFIGYFYQSDPKLQDALLKQFGVRLESGAVTAHWQWQAEGRPEMIMLVHYDKNGREIGRSPVRMTYTGLPAVTSNEKGCEKLWRALLNQPMMLDGFRVHADYYRGSLIDKNPLSSHCRFRLSRGTHFDYFIYTGEVVHEGE